MAVGVSLYVKKLADIIFKVMRMTADFYTWQYCKQWCWSCSIKS